MKPKVYVETSVVSYLTAWPSRDVVILGNQVATREWWRQAVNRFELVVSEYVRFRPAPRQMLRTWPSR